jgi:cyclopropane fatty-acyl-phospholipid synthase-like methyltransferase
VGRYEALYREFDSPLMRRIRREAYGEDVGQHSWVRADDLRRDASRLGLSPTSRVLDLGCGPCGPITFLLSEFACSGTGVELSHAALQAGGARAAELGVRERLTRVQADLDVPLPVQPRRFDAAISLDVVLHLRDRTALFREAARALKGGGRFLLTDAGIRAGPISAEEERQRSLFGPTRFVAPGVNERLLTEAGFTLLVVEDRTASVMQNARGRLAAIEAHREELSSVWPAAEFGKQRAYLETCIELSGRGSLSRVSYLAQVEGRERSRWLSGRSR